MRQLLVDYYENTRQYYGRYHDHKEISAWGGLALLVLFCGLVVSADTPHNYETIAAVGSTVFLLLAAFFVFLYIQNQLSMKDLGGAYSAAATHLLAEIILKQEGNLDAESYLKQGEKRNANTKAQSSHILPERLLAEANTINATARGYQDTTRWMMYALLLLSTVSAIAVKWMLVLDC